ncbi:MAG: HAMP domain-containing sensor histidine kinase [Methylobacterium frigidaeris]
MTRIGLRDPDPAEERRFQEDYILRDFATTRVYMVAAAVIYYLFSIWDRILGPDHWPVTVAIRTGIVFGVMLPVAAATLSPVVLRRAEPALLVFTTLPVCSLSVIYGYLDNGYDHGTAGTILLVLFVAALLPMRAGFFAAFCLVAWVGFALCEAVLAQQPAGLYLVNNFTLGTALMLSVYSVASREIGARRRFRIASELHEAKRASDAALADLRSAQAHLVQAEKLASLGQLVAGVAHEINTPIGVAVMTATTLDADARHLGASIEGGAVRRSDLVQGLGRIREGARILFSNLDRAADLVHSFKQVAVDRSTEERRQVEMAAWLHELLTSLSPLVHRKGHRFVTDCPPGLGIETHPGALAQVVSNLALNAVVHAYPDGRPGTLTIAVSRRAEGGIRLLFRDDGAGIAPEHVGRVFDPFFTTRRGQGSTGLGLQIVHNLVTATLGGRISLASEPGSGTCFTLDLPASLADQPETGA